MVDELGRFVNIRAEDHEQPKRSRNAGAVVIDEVNMIKKENAGQDGPSTLAASTSSR